MKQISRKQSKINRTLRDIKLKLVYESERCRLCGRKAVDLAHLLPRSMYPEHQTKEWNVTLLCRRCHVRFDEDKEFRRESNLGEHIKGIDINAYNRYYD